MVKIKRVLALVFVSTLCFSYEITIDKKIYQQRIKTQSLKYKNIKPLWQQPYNLNANNIKIAIFDGGKIFLHKELNQTKIKQNQLKNPISPHATRVAGIIAAKGIKKNVRGIANKAVLYNFFYKNFNLDKAIKKAIKVDINISNHSYLANYKKQALLKVKNINNLIYKNPTHIAVFAAGNTKKQKKFMIKNISITSCAKNVLTIGACDANFSKTLFTSAKGPTYDFRIKPDFVYRGLFIYTIDTDPKNPYNLFRGTSYATAFVSSIVALVSQAYKKRFKKDITFDLLKSIFIITANDIAAKGVDNFSGYGAINAKKAVDFIYDKNFFKKTKRFSLKSNQTKEFKLVLNKKTNLKAAICWIDPPQKLNATKSLVNDIDLILFNNDKKYYPFSVNEKNLKIIKKPNHHDTCEFINQTLKKGTYTLKIKANKLATKDQNITLVLNTPLYNPQP